MSQKERIDMYHQFHRQHEEVVAGLYSKNVQGGKPILICLNFNRIVHGTFYIYPQNNGQN